MPKKEKAKKGKKVREDERQERRPTPPPRAQSHHTSPARSPSPPAGRGRGASAPPGDGRRGRKPGEHQSESAKYKAEKRAQRCDAKKELDKTKSRQWHDVNYQSRYDMSPDDYVKEMARVAAVKWFKKPEQRKFEE